MSKRSDLQTDPAVLREQVIGLGHQSIRKNHYALLRKHVRELERFRDLLNSTSELILIASLQSGLLVDANDGAARALGVSAEQLKGRPLIEFWPALADGDLYSQVAGARLDHQTFTLFKRADGSTFPVEGSCTLQRQGSTELVAVVVHDVSERHRAEQALRENQKLLRTIIDSAGAVICVHDTQGRLILCNSQYEQVVGGCNGDVIGKCRAHYLPADIAAEHEANDKQVTASGSMTSFEERLLLDDGLHHYLTIKCPITESGQIVAVVGVSTDITERRKVEEQLKLSASILAATGEGVMVTDASGTILSINQAFTDITGYEDADVIGQTPSMLQSGRHEPDFFQVMWDSLRRSGGWQGEIWNRRKSGEVYPEWLTITAINNEEGELTHYVGVFADISSLKRSQAELEKLAHFDPLTGLPNRVLLQDRLTSAIDRATRAEKQIALLILDLDGFKTVNDSLGHPVGDQLLCGVAQRLKGCMREEDTVARLGGDEFAVVVAHLDDADVVGDIVAKLLRAIPVPLELGGFGAHVTASIGVAIFPHDGKTVTELMRNADAAMYGAKEAGRNTYHFYREEMTVQAQQRLLLERCLRRAISEDEFEIWYQPQLDVVTGRLVGAEALVRWNDPERGLIFPDQFIGVAERAGLILDLGELVLQKVCSQVSRWQRSILPVGRVAVNVAALQIDRGNFIETLMRVIASSGVSADTLEIEITESLLMENADHAQQVLASIQSLGLTTAVDDFGTGYSSLAYLKQLPINKLKIDKTFIDDLPLAGNDMAITRAIIGLGHNLGFRVIAEGVETEEQRTILEDLGCNEVQGYLISRPLPVDQFEQWLRSHVQGSSNLLPLGDD